MPIADYSTLVAEIKVWCARSDSVFSARVPTFISMAEDRIYDGYGDSERDGAVYSPPLRTKALEASSTITVTDGAGALPSNTTVLAPRKLYMAGDKVGVDYLPPERFAALAAALQGGTPGYFTIEGTTVLVAPSSSGSMSLLYYKRWPPLSLTDNTNAVLLDHANIYLEAALYEAFSFMQASDLAIAHAARCRALVEGANRSATSLRFAGPLRVRHRRPLP